MCQTSVLLYGFTTDTSVLQIGSIVGFQPDSSQTESKTAKCNLINTGIIQSNINVNNCDVMDLHNDKLYKNVSWRSFMYYIH